MCSPLICALPARRRANAEGYRVLTVGEPAGLCFPASETGTFDSGVVTSSQTVLGKRPRDDDDAPSNALADANDYEIRPSKKGKAKTVTTKRVLVVGGSENRAHHQPATRTLEGTNRKSKAVRRGAERPAAPNTQGVYHRFLEGSSTQQDSMSTIAQGQLRWVDGNADGAGWHHTGSTVQEQDVPISANDGESEAAGESLASSYPIPKRHNEWNGAMLLATPADWARGAVRVLKCRLCPDLNFSKWEDFKRHSDLSETHPRTILFCDSCGDYFARSDSLKRHREKPPPECLKVSPTTADDKRKATERAHVDFVEHMGHCLRSGERLEATFAQMIKSMYPESSKRGRRQESCLQASK
jgi:hypothetical protein